MTGGVYKALAGRIGQLVQDIQRVVQEFFAIISRDLEDFMRFLKAAE